MSTPAEHQDRPGQIEDLRRRLCTAYSLKPNRNNQAETHTSSRLGHLCAISREIDTEVEELDVDVFEEGDGSFAEPACRKAKQNADPYI